MTTAIAMPPAMPRPPPVPIAAARPKAKRPMSGKENLIQVKPVSSVGIPNNIRTRRERPCDACRRRKSRCVIHEGAVLCVLCEFHKQECTFVQSPVPRKRKPTGDGNKEEVSKKRSVTSISPPLAVQVASITPPASSPPKSPTIPRHFETLGETIGLQRSQHCRYIGPTTPYDSRIIGLAQFDKRNESSFNLGTLRRVTNNECFLMLSDDTTQEYGDEVEALRAVEQLVAPHGPALIDLYFRTVHPSFPIIQKQLYLERHRSGDQQLSPSLLAGIYILALNWWSSDPRLAPLPKPDTRKLEALASKWLASSMQRPKLSTVQAGLLLLQRPDADSWSLTTQLVAIGQELGLHLDCSNWSIPAWERGLRKRLAWALYMQDKWSSLIHGRPSHIFSANWAVRPNTDEDYEDERVAGAPRGDSSEEDKAEEERGQTHFAQMIALTRIMAEVMDTFYTQVAISDFEAAGKSSTRLILERAKPVQIKLKDWFAKLPASCKMDSLNGGRLSPNGSLHLAYFATEITLHRRIVQSLNPETADAYLMYICRSAAKTRLISAMDFVNRLKPEHLQAFWYFASKINFTLIGTFGSLLWATAPAKEEADFYKTRLREYRWTLSVSSKRAEFLDYAVQMLDASRGMLSNLAEKPLLAQLQVSNAGVPAERTGPLSLPRDQTGGDAGSELGRYNFAPTFSGFPTEALDQYGMEEDLDESPSGSSPMAE